jgi:hypothetical protein
MTRRRFLALLLAVAASKPKGKPKPPPPPQPGPGDNTIYARYPLYILGKDGSIRRLSN